MASSNNLNVFENGKFRELSRSNPGVSRQLRNVLAQRTYFPVGHKMASFWYVAAQAISVSLDER